MSKPNQRVKMPDTAAMVEYVGTVEKPTYGQRRVVAGFCCSPAKIPWPAWCSLDPLDASHAPEEQAKPGQAGPGFSEYSVQPLCKRVSSEEPSWEPAANKLFERPSFGEGS